MSYVSITKWDPCVNNLSERKRDIELSVKEEI